jgi:xylulokinase
MSLLLGIDAGTTSVKAGLFEPEGGCVSIARQPYQLDTPAPDRVEADPLRYWDACCAATHRVLAESRRDPRQVSALAVSSQGETILPVDEHGTAIGPAIVWLDNRARDEAGELAALFGDQVYPRTGIVEIVPAWSACKILWLKNHEPELMASTHKFLLVQDYLVHWMTGALVTDGSVACTTLLYDIVRHCWWDEMLQAVGLKAPRLPEIAKPGTVVGRLTESAGAAMGLPGGLPVVLGGMDQAAGAVGAGNLAPGIVSETTGAALAIQVTISAHVGDAASPRLPVCVHSAPDLYLLEPFCPTAGLVLQWFRDTFGPTDLGDDDGYDRLTDLASAVPAGSDGLLMLPHLMGAGSPEYNPKARGVFCGITLGHHQGHFVRAILEAVAYLLRRNLDLVSDAGICVAEIRSGGGAARSPLWSQIKADVCGLPVARLQQEEAALLGDAMMAGVACGELSGLAEASQSMVSMAGRWVPGEQQPAYRASYARYRELNATLDPFFRGS